MKTLGIVGGLGPESTIDYYRLLIAAYRKRTHEEGYPPLLIHSLDVDKGIRLVSGNHLEELADYLGTAIGQLAAAGADYALLAANTPHIVFDQLRERSPLPLLSIVEATCDEVLKRGGARCGLLGTRFTMSGRFYPEVFERRGFTLVSPMAEEQAEIHQKYINELLVGKFLPETRERIHQIVATMKERDGIEAVILAGTELPLLLRAEEIHGLPLLDTTQIHVEAAIREMFT